MDVLVSIVKNILVIVILSSLMEMLLPQGGLSQYVRFAIGLFILIAILNPVINHIYQNNASISAWDYQDNRQLDEYLVLKGKKINQQISQNYEQALKEKIQGQINAMTSLVPGIDTVDTKITLSDGEKITKMEVIVKTKRSNSVTDITEVEVNSGGYTQYSKEEEQELSAKIKFLLNNFYTLNDAQLNIKFEGSRNHDK